MRRPTSRRLSAVATVLASALALLTGCATTNEAPVLPAQRQAQSLAQEAARAREFDKQVLKELAVVDDPALNAYVRGVARKLDPARPRGAFATTIRIIDDEVPNAFTVGGGYIYLHTGLLKIFDNEAQLAMVVGHEMAHGDANHISTGGQARQNAAMAQAGLTVLGAILGVPAEAAAQASGLGVTAVYSSFSRDQERQADAFGFDYLLDAGYNVSEGAKAFQKLQEAAGGGQGSPLAAYLSTHPLSQERFRTLTARAAAARPGGRIGDADYRRAVLNRL